MTNGVEQNLITIVKNASKGDKIVVDDLIVCCKTVKDLVEIVHIIYNKNLFIHSIKQPWFDTNNSGENVMILLLKLERLQKQMVDYHQRMGKL